MKIGVLAIQGDFAAHIRMLGRLDVESIEVRRSEDLETIDGLIVPGGESTTMLKFVSEEGLAEPIKGFARLGKPIFGTCAGAILLAREVTGPPQSSLGLIDITVERNAYGRQVDSFVGDADTELEGGPIESVFIRAPRITRLGPQVETLARVAGSPVLVSEGNILVATFHPELTKDQRVHRLFVDRAQPGNHLLLENTKDEALQMG
jgi:5'-phosphate synthase pdxT subunit